MAESRQVKDDGCSEPTATVERKTNKGNDDDDDDEDEATTTDWGTTMVECMMNQDKQTQDRKGIKEGGGRGERERRRGGEERTRTRLNNNNEYVD
jgi:hypothetical protein